MTEAARPAVARPSVLSLNINSKSALYAAYMSFLTNGGIFVPTPRPYKIGDEVFMLLQLMDDPTRHPVAGTVAWITPHGAQGGKTHLLKARVGGAGEVVTLSENVLSFTQPDWSPDGHHVLFVANDGLAIVPASGGDARLLSEEAWLAVTWSADGRSVYGLREAEQNRHFMLASIDVATGAERVINRDVGVIPPANQPIRGLTRLGKDALVTSIARARSDIWMLEGFVPPRSIGARLWATLRGAPR